MDTLQNPTGLRFIESLIKLLRNSDEIEKALATIHKARDEANERIAVVGKIADIERFRNEAVALLEEATGTLSNAEKKANAILQEAGARADAEQKAQGRADTLIAGYQTKLKALEKREDEVGKREQEVRDDLAQARTLKDDFSALFN
ncbi:MAG: hypothetical protein IH974_01080 [Myxococcales bacterium]|nr:hypothetical protein [Myxococcales bacterium]